MLYSYKGNQPDTLPDRIRLSNGLTRTDSSTFTEEEILDAGYILVDSKPIVDEMQYRVVWDSSTIQWSIIELTDQEKQAKIQERWNLIRQERDEMLKASDIIALRELEETGHVSEDAIAYRQKLRDITQQSSPLHIKWPSINNTVQPAGMD